MMSQLILTDVDDTILHFAQPFQQWVEEQGIQTHAQLRSIYDVETMLGIENRQMAIDLMRDYCRAVEGQQPPEECALEVLPKLYDQGFRSVAITACGLDPVFKAQRERNLEAVFGFKFEAVHVVELRGCKRDVLRKYPSSIWVEDNWDHAVAGAELGHRSFVVHRDYNADRDHPQITRVSCWRDLHTRIAGRS